MKKFSQSPLPFQGQKRKFVKEVKSVLRDCPDDIIYVDLFGGSGLLSHTVKQLKPNSVVVYNDYDGFVERLQVVGRTNSLLAKIRRVTEDLPRHKLIPSIDKLRILEIIEAEEQVFGYVDYITLSSSLLFSAKYVTNFPDLAKQEFYNNVRKNDYVVDGYLDGVEWVSEDYKALFERYKSCKNVVYLVDPPYLSTDTTTYNSDKYWRLADYLNVLDVLSGTNFLYFTSNKSQILELCDWMESRTGDISVNPFKGATTVSINTTLNYSSSYVDIMSYKLK